MRLQRFLARAGVASRRGSEAPDDLWSRLSQRPEAVTRSGVG